MINSLHHIPPPVKLSLKFAISAGLLYYVYHELLRQDALTQLVSLSLNFTSNHWAIISAVIALMVFNWTIEAFKWKTLLNPGINVSFSTALKGTLIGTSFSMLTPNRTGDFMGRATVLLAEQRIKGSAYTLFANASQLLVSIILGLLGTLTWLIAQHKIPFPLFAIGVVTCIVVLLLVLYFKPRIFQQAISRIPFLGKRFTAHGGTAAKLTTSKLSKTLALSCLRFVVFSTQYLVLLKLFGHTSDILSLYIGIAATYFVTTLVPSISLAELGIREVSALIFLDPNHLFSAPVALATFVLWIINIALPALAGAWLLTTQTRRA